MSGCCGNKKDVANTQPRRGTIKASKILGVDDNVQNQDVKGFAPIRETRIGGN